MIEERKTTTLQPTRATRLAASDGKQERRRGHSCLSARVKRTRCGFPRNGLLRYPRRASRMPVVGRPVSATDSAVAKGLQSAKGTNVDFDELLRVLASFSEKRVEYILIGAAALNVHNIIRATDDVDVFVRPDRENIARLRDALRSVFADPEIDKITAEDLLGEYPAVQYVTPDGTFQLDILTRLGEAFSWRDLESEVVDIQSIPVRVATPRTLYRMKRDTVRPKDKLDAMMLREAFGLTDES